MVSTRSRKQHNPDRKGLRVIDISIIGRGLTVTGEREEGDRVGVLRRRERGFDA